MSFIVNDSVGGRSDSPFLHWWWKQRKYHGAFRLKGLQREVKHQVEEESGEKVV